MLEPIILYKVVQDDIKITIEAYFENDFLVIDGYDIGKRVEEYWGDSDYEYRVKIPKEGIDFLYHHLNVEPENRKALLQALASNFNTNSCYSEIRKLMSDNKIPCEGFTWT